MIADKAGGMYASDRVYDDSKVEDIESLDPKTQIHRDVDVELVAADQTGTYCRDAAFSSSGLTLLFQVM